ncbi:type II secretion system F family protein [Mycolicibacterium sp. S2-37]|uniref:type II secretion system F family protein n=1 Tax=Mycolicibacterium sp. S2-37 TaxID=2810297 RepID=UPI001A93F282|nr:type II secretion system F family protein [Mycolicibacterium sp. S2-37]MBO0680977.1 type II secretion system F family protein [Mycolicibacterium sp. S2-37]
MSVAAVALALAVLISPHDVRHRLPFPSTPARTRGRRGVIGVVAAASAIALGTVAPIAVPITVGIIAGTVALRGRRRRVRQRYVAESAALQGALDVLVGELRAGAHPVAAFETAAEEADGAVTDSLRAVAARARLGADVAGGLHAVARESEAPAHWTRIAVCWQLAQAHGLAIATLMGTAQRDIAERHRFASRVDAGMAGARATAGVLAGLPVLGIGLGQMIGAEPVRFLFADGFGGWLLVIGMGLSCAGLLWSDRITTGVLA